MCLSIIPVYVYDMWCCSWPWKSTFVCALLLRDKYAEILPNSRVDRPRENTNVNMIDHVHGLPTVVRWRKRRD